MRLIYLAVIASMTGIAPAVAGTDAGDAPNPFTDLSAGQPSTATQGGGIPTSDPTQFPIPSTGVNGDLIAPPADQARSSESFYQAQKKDTDAH
jgi:hypothetical protein